MTVEFESETADSDTYPCQECGREFPEQELAVIYDTRICANCKPVVVQEIKEGTYGNVSASIGGFWIRALAKVLDGVFILLLLVPVYALMMYLTGISLSEFASDKSGEAIMKFQVINMIGQFVQIVIAVGYNTYFLGKFSATPGKMICSLKAVTVEMEEFGYGRALGRTMCEWISGMICWLGYLLAAFDEEKRTLHDRIASTRVIYD